MPFTELCHPLVPATCSHRTHNNDLRLNTLLQTSVLPYTFFSREIFTYKSLVLEVKLILPFLTAPEFPGFSWSPGISMVAKALSCMEKQEDCYAKRCSAHGCDTVLVAVPSLLRSTPSHPSDASGSATVCHNTSHTPTHCGSDLTADNIFYSEVVAVNLTNFGLHPSEVVTASF